jgi:hypothetical protein
MAPTEIDTLIASWKDLSELVPIEHSTSPRSIPSTKASKAQVKAHFQSPGRSAHPISCPRLPALGIPQQIVLINHTRNNVRALQYYMANNPAYLAHRMLFMRDFISAPRYTTAETYLWAEQGEPVVEVNGRPLKVGEQLELDFGRTGEIDMLSLQPTPMPLRKGVRNLQVQITYEICTDCVRQRQGCYGVAQVYRVQDCVWTGHADYEWVHCGQGDDGCETGGWGW